MDRGPYRRPYSYHGVPPPPPPPVDPDGSGTFYTRSPYGVSIHIPRLSYLFHIIQLYISHLLAKLSYYTSPYTTRLSYYVFGDPANLPPSHILNESGMLDPEWYMPVVELFDGLHTPQNITLYSFGLGWAVGAGATFFVFAGWFPHIVAFGTALAVFHYLEYATTALYNPRRLSLQSFLFDPAPGYQYQMCMVLVFVEFLLELFLFPNLKSWMLLNYLGIGLMIGGQLLRTLALVTAKSSFSHLVAEWKEEDHRLITHGVYAFERHPSYVGFYLWVLGGQIVMMNPICLIAFSVVLYLFFRDRIIREERFLIGFFGDRYVVYKAVTPTAFPFIP